MVAAWKFSEAAPGVVEEHVPMLARACELDPQQLWDCVASLVRYYQVCFPDAAKGSHAAVFMPIHEDTNTTETSRTVSPAESSSSTESALASEEGGAAEPSPPSSSSSALYVRVGPEAAEGPEEPPSLCQQGSTW